MTKAEIVSQIAEKTGCDKKKVASIIDSFFSTLQGSMARGKTVYLRGFGSFTNKKRAKKTARNISKGTSIVIPEHYTPIFRPAKSFVQSVRKNVKG